MDENVRVLAVELAMHLGHTFADVREPAMPGPETVRLAESIIGGLSTRGYVIVPNNQRLQGITSSDLSVPEGFYDDLGVG